MEMWLTNWFPGMVITEAFQSTPQFAWVQVSLSGNLGLEQALPDQWGDFLVNLQFLDVSNTGLRAPLGAAALLPSFLAFSTEQFVEVVGSNMRCPVVVGGATPLTVSMDVEYYGMAACVCDEGYFGVNGTCVKVCVCVGGGGTSKW
jgi:hypothetical protein